MCIIGKEEEEGSEHNSRFRCRPKKRKNQAVLLKEDGECLMKYKSNVSQKDMKYGKVIVTEVSNAWRRAK